MDSTWSYGTTFQPTAFGSLNFTAGNDFTFVDFLPDVQKPGGIFTSPKFENFKTLVDRANDFLRSNPKWQIVTCESVEFKSRGDTIDYLKMTYMEYGKGSSSYVRGLRLWLTQKNDANERVQQIGYFNIIPEKLEEGGIFSSPKFETLNTVIDKCNSMLRSNPLPGRIINIESQEMKIPNFNSFDADRSRWTERGKGYNCFLFVLRIFYEVMPYQFEEIGIADFVPRQIAPGGVFSHPKYEPFSNVIQEASNWCAQQQGLRFCNAQTLEIKLKQGKEFSNQRMNYTECNYLTYYVRILRVAYTKPFVDPDSIVENALPMRITCKTFLPVQLTSGFFVPDYENLVDTKKRVSAWVKATGARVLNAETAAYRLMTGGERKRGIEASFTYNVDEKSEYWIFVIRLFLDGVYREPPPEALPDVPVIEQTCCSIL